MVTGQDHDRRANAAIVELKQWEETERSYVDDCVVTFVGGRLRDQLHPSKQVGNYQRYLQDVHTVFSNALVGLQACSYLHNLVYAQSAELFDQRHSHLLAANPLFAGDQVDGLAGFLDANVGGGHGGPVLDTSLVVTGPTNGFSTTPPESFGTNLHTFCSTSSKSCSTRSSPGCGRASSAPHQPFSS